MTVFTTSPPTNARRSLGLRHRSQRAGPALVMIGTVTILALPSAVLAFSTRFDVPPTDFAVNEGLGAFAPGRIDPRLARAMATRPAGNAALFRFTPAGLATRPDRSVTVAVRVDDETARTITVKGALRPPAFVAANVTGLRIAPAAYNLGLSRGYSGFNQSPANFVLPPDARHADMPDLSAYTSVDRPGTGGSGETGLAPRILLDDRQRAGRSPRTLESTGEQSVDVGGSYRVSRNFDVTAGVRYSRDSDRLKPLPDGKTDNQSVFVGTQFKF